MPVLLLHIHSNVQCPHCLPPAITCSLQCLELQPRDCQHQQLNSHQWCIACVQPHQGQLFHLPCQQCTSYTQQCSHNTVDEAAVPCRRKGLFHLRTLSPSDRLVMAWIFLVGFVDLTYTAFLMPLLIIFPTNNTMYSWASPVNLILGGSAPA